jgi:NAD(P)-dependent dehydrogenase (short-subunit alcohol dehydrogenase family)
MDLGLTDKTVLVTGSTAGIGLATAIAFAREGARVCVNGRTAERVEAARAQVLAAAPGADVQGVAADVSSAAGADALCRALPDVDVLINNAGWFEPRPFAEISDAEWLRMLDTNLLSGVRLSRHHLPRMLARGWGRVVFVSSESGVQIPTEMIHYGVSKTAQIAVARGMAELTTGTRVTVNSVLPGPTMSEGVERFVGELAGQRGVDAATVEREFFSSARPTSLLRRFTTPEEVAAMIVYTASEAASATNGAALRCDGGVVRAIL